MSRLAKSPWSFKPYIGSYINKDSGILLVFMLARGRLTVTVWASADIPMVLLPHSMRSSTFPADMFPIGVC